MKCLHGPNFQILQRILGRKQGADCYFANEETEARALKGLSRNMWVGNDDSKSRNPGLLIHNLELFPFFFIFLNYVFIATEQSQCTRSGFKTQPSCSIPLLWTVFWHQGQTSRRTWSPASRNTVMHLASPFKAF